MMRLMLIGLFCCSWAFAVETRSQLVDSASEFAEGESLSASISDRGYLGLGYEAKNLIELNERKVWSIAYHTKNKEWILGSGSKGEVLGLKASGEMRVIATLPESEVYAVSVSPQGEIFAATSPKGKVYRIHPQGAVEVYYNPQAEYLWVLAWDSQGALLVGTGGQGQVHRVTEKNKGEMLCDSTDAHVRSILVGEDGTLFIGTAGRGLTLKVTDKNKVSVLHELGENSEVRALGLAKNGLWIGGNVMPVSASSASTAGRSPTPSAEAQRPVGHVFFINHQQAPEHRWVGKFTVQSGIMRGDKFWVGSGTEGYFMEFSENRSWKIQGKVNAEQVTELAYDGQSLIGVSANPAAVFSLHPVSQGVYHSKPSDAGMHADWGQIQVQGEGQWKVWARSGNTAKPDSTWNAWQQADAQRLSAPSARYFQWKLDIEKGTVDWVRWYHVQHNQPPVVRRVEVLELPVEVTALPPSTPAQPPLTLEAILKLERERAQARPTQFQALTKSGMRTAVWQATDANGDDLSFSVWLRSQQQSSWQKLKDDLKEPLWSWDTTPWAEGVYKVKVVADDAPSNAGGSSMKHELESRPFVIDRTPPLITWIGFEAKTRTARFKVTDALSHLQKVEVSWDGQEFWRLEPKGAPLDGGVAEFECEVPEGTASLMIRAEDEAGNVSGFQGETK